MSNVLVSKVVLGLENSSRLKKFYNQPNAKDFRHFRAVDGKHVPYPVPVDNKGFRDALDRDALPGEIGCAISHFLILKEFSESNADDNDLLLVAEDDALFYKKIGSILKKVIDKVDWKDTGIVVLGSAGDIAGVRDISYISQRLAVLSIRSKIVGWATTCPFVVGKYSGHAIGTGLYLITKKAAKKYANYVQNHGAIGWPADFYHIWAEESGIEIQILRPSLASWVGETTIGGGAHSMTTSPKSVTSDWKTKFAVRTRVRRFLIALRAG